MKRGPTPGISGSLPESARRRGVERCEGDADAPRVVLDLEPSARWVAEVHPTEAVEDLGDGRLRVTLSVSARPWLERLLLTLGPLATLVHVDDRLGGPETARAAARRILARYGAGRAVR